MHRRVLLTSLLAAALSTRAQHRPDYRVDVEMVVLTFSVGDGKGRPVTGLKPEDVQLFEDGVPQKIVSLSEGGRTGAGGASVFVLFDTSNHMYRMFPYVCDAIAGFVRRLDPADSVAIYTFSRNLFRAAPLTNDHEQARAGLTRAVAGDDTALFNALLLTIRDAAKAPGRKAIVVFSNGADNASAVAPGDVGRVAEDEGIPVYIISTQDAAQNPPLAAALESITRRTGGALYRARSWENQSAAFTTVREEIASSYTLSYYPAPNPNQGFRQLRIELLTEGSRQYRIRTRTGYEAHKSAAPPGQTKK